MNTQTFIATALLVLACQLQVPAVVISYDSGFANSGNVPDGNASGWSDTRTVSGLAGQIEDVKVSLELTGGWNGDLYAYLAHEGETTVLLNRVGVGSSSPFGYSDAGLQVTLSDAAAGDIHLYALGAITGGAAWQPDGRTISPASPSADFDAAARLGLITFRDLNPNGGWTLFVADVSGGGGLSKVTRWGLDLTLKPVAVPEPALGTVALLGALAAWVAAVVRARRRAGRDGRMAPELK